MALAGIKLTAPASAVRHVTDCATWPDYNFSCVSGISFDAIFKKMNLLALKLLYFREK